MFSGTRSKSLISVTGEVIITRNVQYFRGPFEIFHFDNGEIIATHNLTNTLYNTQLTMYN